MYFKGEAEAAQALPLMFHSLLLAVPAVQCQHLRVSLLPLFLPQLHQLCPCRNAAKPPAVCASWAFTERCPKRARCPCSVSPLGHPSPVAASTPACQHLLLLRFPNPPFCSGLVKHSLIPWSAGYFLFYSAAQFLHEKVAFVNKISFRTATSVLSCGPWTEKALFAEAKKRQ